MVAVDPQVGGIVAREAVLWPLSGLCAASWNANRVKPGVLAKVRRSMEEFGVVENLVARRLPGRDGVLEVVSGNHRLEILREMGVAEAPVVVVDLSDADARILAQTLNRTRGEDDPEAYARLLEEVLESVGVERAVEFLPETPASIDRVLAGIADPFMEDELPLPVGEPRSKFGEVYELGAHRLMCGDATDDSHIESLLAGQEVAVLVTDPPYGVGVDHRWREEAGKTRLGSARGAIAGDDQAEWASTYAAVPAAVAYVWHSALHAGLVQAGLEAAGFEVRQQIVWVKDVFAIGRGAYQWKHETCWYAVRRGATARWDGGHSQTTVWEAPSPIHIMGGGQDDVRTSHPTQKPLAIFEPPILNHTAKGDVVCDPFAGSGTALIAAERAGRRCFAMELDPWYCDVIRNRYEALHAVGEPR